MPIDPGVFFNSIIHNICLCYLNKNMKKLLVILVGSFFILFNFPIFLNAAVQIP